MKLNLGAEPKKVAMLGGLVLVLGYFLYSNVIAPSDDAPPSATRSSAAVKPAANVFGVPAPESGPKPIFKPNSRAVRQEFKMTSREKRPDPTSIDPTLRLDLLAKVQSVNLEGGERNLFQFGAAPLPKTPEPKIIPLPKGQPQPAAGEPNGKPVEPPKPPPPPIPLKFYGYAAPSPSGVKRVFFLDGDDIVVAGEGELIKGRYKVVTIGINSVVVEDVPSQHQQTLALEEQAG